MTAQTSKTDKIQQKRQRKCDSIKRNEEYRNRKMNEFFIGIKLELNIKGEKTVSKEAHNTNTSMKWSRIVIPLHFFLLYAGMIIYEFECHGWQFIDVYLGCEKFSQHDLYPICVGGVR